jgi:hypothetical protein
MAISNQRLLEEIFLVHSEDSIGENYIKDEVNLKLQYHPFFLKKMLQTG